GGDGQAGGAGAGRVAADVARRRPAATAHRHPPGGAARPAPALRRGRRGGAGRAQRQVLAMASLPSYDNNIYGPPVDTAALQAAATAPGHPMLEGVSQVALPPGSTFKLVVATAGVLNPIIPPERVIPTGGSFTLGGHTFDNWRVMGPMNLAESIAW